MSNKYDETDKKKVLDIHVYFTAYEQDIIDKWNQEYDGLNIHRVAWYESDIISKKALEDLGSDILKDSANPVCYYQVAIPSESVLGGNHAVAFMIDHEQKIMRYHDSHGVDMRREIKDFLRKLFPDYRIYINFSKQQADVISKTDGKENDNSCALLSLYNLRDMWFEQNGMPNKICNYDSVSARQDVWKILSTVQKPENRPVKFSFGKVVIGATETKEKKEQYTDAVKKLQYRLYNEPNYDELINQAVKNVRASF